MTKKQSDFIYFLEDTLIPDLIESGRESIAKDFEEGIVLLRGVTTSTGYRTDAKSYIKFLREQLIPDLKDSGMTSTAKDFATLARMIETEMKRR